MGLDHAINRVRTLLAETDIENGDELTRLATNAVDIALQEGPQPDTVSRALDAAYERLYYPLEDFVAARALIAKAHHLLKEEGDYHSSWIDDVQEMSGEPGWMLGQIKRVRQSINANLGR